jgi:hypothetical protein
MQYRSTVSKVLFTHLGIVLLACSGNCTQMSGSAAQSSSTSSSHSLETGNAAGALPDKSDAKPPLVSAATEAAAQPGSPTPKHSVSLSWKASTSVGVRYNVYRRGLTGEPLKLNSGPAQNTSYVDSPVEAGQIYFYTVKAIDSKGTPSTPSNEVKVEIPSH